MREYTRGELYDRFEEKYLTILDKYFDMTNEYYQTLVCSDDYYSKWVLILKTLLTYYPNYLEDRYHYMNVEIPTEDLKLLTKYETYLFKIITDKKDNK